MTDNEIITGSGRAAHRRTGKVYLNLDCNAIDVRPFRAPLATESIK
jgi:hypothetical protein